jgi:hypothetical protein
VTISVYVASRFPDQEAAKKLRVELADRGIGCTSRWLEEECSLGNLPASDEQKIRFARMDRYDVRRAQAVVLWNPNDKAQVGTGGCHNETGMAFMLAELPVFVIGRASNIFHFLPEARVYGFAHYTTDSQLFDELADEIREECGDFGPTWDSPAEQQAKFKRAPILVDSLGRSPKTSG